MRTNTAYCISSVCSYIQLQQCLLEKASRTRDAWDFILCRENLYHTLPRFFGFWARPENVLMLSRCCGFWVAEKCMQHYTGIWLDSHDRAWPLSQQCVLNELHRHKQQQSLQSIGILTSRMTFLSLITYKHIPPIPHLQFKAWDSIEWILWFWLEVFSKTRFRSAGISKSDLKSSRYSREI